MPKSPSPEIPETQEASQEHKDIYSLEEPISPHKRVRPVQEPKHQWYKEYTPPQRAKVQGTIEYLEAKGIPYYKTDVFSFFKTSKSSGYEML
jgi:hypothetical protein